MKTKNYVITGGSFTTAGNFTGYTAIGERLHFHKRQMEQLGWADDKAVKTPFYAVGAVKQIGQLDENSKPLANEDGTPVLVDRLTALSAFKTKQELINAHVDATMIDAEIAQTVKTQASTAGLSEASIEALLQATF
jgi:hypothetical protein